MTNGKIMSTAFKTSHLYQYQTISVSVLVQCYVDYFRVDTVCDKLFVTTRGEPMKQGMINKGLQEYFAYFGLELSITTVRKMLESACFEALQEGAVSMEQYLSSCAAQVRLFVCTDNIKACVVVDDTCV